MGVHCEYGQNRSGSIVCAYAVLHLRWTADAAISYMRERNFADRHYDDQEPMCNPLFCQIIAELERDRATILPSTATAHRGTPTVMPQARRVFVAPGHRQVYT